ncbi:MAG: Asp-tRNA(Asn)/Glu-tRNA(Gln) amidotransferase subunit GatB [Clostridiales bacterium]|nr:Asp-tRNA(Asn)/Glu-tRNA(Gln) amidotransferase subunit GatB [Clostridiales bacterium]
MEYEMICGIETHIELATKTKIFCGCTTAFGGAPNTHCCPVCTGQPGALPVLNKSVAEFAVRAGRAVNCRINNNSHMDRKNYCYPDLPKAYQISQFDEPVCENGYIELESGKKIGITRIHIEEDAGKLVHENGQTYIDYNRGGVPLIEIVSEPDIRTAEEAREYAEKLQLIMRYVGVSDCKMQEGSMRCDVNISIHKPGTEFGTRTELKNINSLSNIVKAIEAEVERQTDCLESGEVIVQATMRYDADSDSVSVMRVKENSDDYRYFPEPDIVRFFIPPEEVMRIEEEIPELPSEKKKRYLNELMLSAEVVNQLYKYKRVTDYFEEVLSKGAGAKNASNLLIRGIYTRMNTEEEKEIFDISLPAEEMSKLTRLVDDKKISFNMAVGVLSDMLSTGKPVEAFISEKDTEGVSDDELVKLCEEAIAANPKAVSDIKNGKEKAINVMFGYIMKATKGKGDTKKASKIIMSIINK